MLDIKKIKNNPDFIKNLLKNRSNNYCAVVDELLETDTLRCDLISKTESMKSTQNSISRKIPSMKKNNGDVTSVLAEMKELSDKITAQEAELTVLEEKQQKILLSIPNVPHESVPMGKSDCDNTEMRKWGEPIKLNFEPLPHWKIGKKSDILDCERAAKVTGSRFHFYKGLGAKLERALINFFLDTHTQNGYTEILPPFMVNRDSMTGTGQLPKFEEDAFKLANAPYFMVPTAEVPVTNIHRDEILNAKDLPIKYCAYSVCFRAEAGSAGRDTRGLIRQHQFNKVELVKFCPQEDSYNELELITKDAEKILQLLELPYRVVCLCAGDLGFCSAKTYDIEVWMPSYNRYVEISSCSNFEDYQARRMRIRYKENPKDKAKFVHTLNGSGLAVGRTVAAILENYQNSDGSVTVPRALKNYLGTDIIK